MKALPSFCLRSIYVLADLEEIAMFLKCTVRMEGPGPSEKIVEVETSDGPMELVVDIDSLCGVDRLAVQPVHRNNGKTLVELPRESTSGQSRVWIFSSNLTDCRTT
jgi:hypothetical protein